MTKTALLSFACMICLSACDNVNQPISANTEQHLENNENANEDITHIER